MVGNNEMNGGAMETQNGGNDAANGKGKDNSLSGYTCASPTGTVGTHVRPSGAQSLPVEVFHAYRPTEFDGRVSWRTWKFKLELEFGARAVQLTDDAKKSTLLRALSVSVLTEVLNYLGDDIHGASYAEVIKFLDDRFETSKTLISRRNEYMLMNETDSETPAEFYRRLRMAETDCEFRKVTDVADFIRVMTFVRGVKDKNLRYLLLKEPKLTGQRCLEIATHFTSTLETLQNLEGRTGEMKMIHTVRKQRCFNSGKGRGKNSRGFAQVDDQVLCYFCDQPGHLQRECQEYWFAKRQRKEVHGISGSQSIDSVEDYGELQVHAVTNLQDNPRMVPVRKDGSSMDIGRATDVGIDDLGRNDWCSREELTLKKMDKKKSKSMGSFLKQNLVQNLNDDIGPFYDKDVRHGVEKAHVHVQNQRKLRIKDGGILNDKVADADSNPAGKATLKHLSEVKSQMNTSEVKSSIRKKKSLEVKRKVRKKDDTNDLWLL